MVVGDRAHRLGFQNAARVRRLMREGRCVGCQRKKHPADLQHQRCRKCRRAHALRERKRHAALVAEAERLHGPIALHFGRLSPREKRLLAFGVKVGRQRARRAA
jgi:hypothetical protein